MQVIESEQLICFDVDDTIFLWNTPETASDEWVSFNNPYNTDVVTVRLHTPHIRVLQQRLARGATIILWSASGYQWAKAAAEACGLTGDKLYIMSKPSFIVDDKPASDWLGNRMYMDPNDKWGR